VFARLGVFARKVCACLDVGAYGLAQGHGQTRWSAPTVGVSDVVVTRWRRGEPVCSPAWVCSLTYVVIMSRETCMKKAVWVLLNALVLLLLAGGPAWAVPPLPSSFYGRVILDGEDVSPGVVVSARINGVKYAETTVVSYEEHSAYAINVPGDDADSPGVEGGVEGDIVVFYVADYRAIETAVWHSATNVEHDVSALSMARDRIYLPVTFK